MDGKAKKRLEVIKQKLQLLQQKLAGAKRQDDEPGEVRNLEQQIAAGRHVNMFPVHEYWLDIGRMEDFQRAQKEIGSL